MISASVAFATLDPAGTQPSDIQILATGRAPYLG